jgi:transcriptional regulator with XRE-family HTH domain
MKLGTALKEIRKSKNKTQDDVCGDLDISQTYLSQVESDKKQPSLPMLRRISNYYKVPIPIIMWKAIEPSDIQASKKKAFSVIKDPVDRLINEFILD